MDYDVIYYKIETIERCINRIKIVKEIIEKHTNDFKEFIFQINKLR